MLRKLNRTHTFDREFNISEGKASWCVIVNFILETRESFWLKIEWTLSKYEIQHDALRDC